MGKGNPWKKDSLPIIRNAVSLYACACWFSKTLTFYLWKISRGGEGGVVSAPFRATFTKGDTSKKYFSVFFFVCLFVRLIIPSSQRKNGGGKLANSIPFVFFPPFPQVNLSIGRFVYFPTFLRRIFSLFLKFVETSEKSKMKILEMEGTNSNHRLIEIRGYSCDPSIFALRINRKLGRSWVAIVALSFRPLASTLSLGESCACFS